MSMEALVGGVAFAMMFAVQIFMLRAMFALKADTAEIKGDVKRINGTIARHEKEIDRLRDKLDT